jgi:hypothetical protein
LYGVDSVCYNGPLGHRYYVNILSQIISQVRRQRVSIVFNICVSSKLNRRWATRMSALTSIFYLRIADSTFQKQGRHHTGFTGSLRSLPCVRLNGHEFFTFEPTLLTGTGLLYLFAGSCPTNVSMHSVGTWSFTQHRLARNGELDPIPFGIFETTNSSWVVSLSCPGR